MEKDIKFGKFIIHTNVIKVDYFKFKRKSLAEVVIKKMVYIYKYAREKIRDR